MLDIKINAIQLRMDESDLKFSFCKGETEWSWTKDYRPKMECKEGTVFFDEALEIHHELVQNGIGKGIRSSFAGFEIEGTKVPYAFETYAWIEKTTEDIFFEWVPICEEGITVEKVFWPGEMELEEKKNDWYTLLNMQQGVLIPNDWETELTAIPFDGFFETAGGYMPWFSQFKGRNGYIAICTTPWNAGYQAEHPENGPYTHVGVRFEPSLGRMDYKRVVRYTLIEDGDYNDACKIYRDYVREQGNLCTLNEKAARVASVDDLIGCSFIHKGIKTFVQPESDFFDPENPDKNNNLTPFAVRTKEMKELHELGAGKLYLHLDGWAEPGYDNKHPDYTPACEEAGGWKDMKELADTMQKQGDLFGIHDQYRDYYFAAESFDEDYACRLTDGTIPTHKRWAGGQQSYLCATQAPHYVKRNFREIEKNQIHLDGAYLDVFTCNEGDEYDDPKTQEGIQCWIDMYNEGLSPSASALSETTADAMFEGGQLAMNFAGSYMVPEYASNDAIKDKVDCVEIPTFNGKEDNCINGLGYAVFEGSKNKEAAEDFAIWLGSKEAQEIQGKTGVVISARTDAQKCFAEANSQYNLAAYTNHADEAYPLPVCTKAAELYDLEATELQKAYNGEESLSDVCKSLTKQADKLLQE